MIITSIQIRRLENSVTKMKGIVSITLDGMVVIHDIKVLKSDSGWFLAMPSKQTKAGTFKDVVHPINSDVRAAFEKLVFFGFEYAEHHNYLRIEMANAKNEAENLLQQEPTDFHIENMDVGYYPNICDAHPNLATPKKKTERESVDDSLLRWLES